MELTVLMPCLNEHETLAFCIGEAKSFLEKSGTAGEILVADNGSTDGSDKIALEHGARVVCIEKRGYGEALRGGIKEARGKYVIMADCDGSYDFSALLPYLEALRSGAVLAVGDRYAYGFERSASPFAHRALGVPFLSFMGRLAQRKYKPPKESLVHDFHCGLRGVERQSFSELETSASGMEFASEMILAVTRARLKIVQLPAGLRRDRRITAKPHLKAVPDGIRHIKLILKYIFD